MPHLDSMLQDPATRRAPAIPLGEMRELLKRARGTVLVEHEALDPVLHSFASLVFTDAGLKAQYESKDRALDLLDIVWEGLCARTPDLAGKIVIGPYAIGSYDDRALGSVNLLDCRLGYSYLQGAHAHTASSPSYRHPVDLLRFSWQDR